MSTPHIMAEKGEIAQTVLMPGDPLRAKFIAENFLQDSVCYNKVRGMLGFTGIYKGERVSVQGSGMGMPSMGIYSHELYSCFGVENIIRIGSAGAISDEVKLRDVVVAIGACTNSAYARQFQLPGDFTPIADFDLLRRVYSAGQRLGISCKFGNVLSSDTFYDAAESTKAWQKMNVLAVEMEAAALYMNAAFFNKKALCILTISDTPIAKKPEFTSAEEREKTFTQMIELALDSIL